MEESHPDETHYHEIVPQNLLYLIGGLFFVLTSLIFALVFLTPIGGMLVGDQDVSLYRQAKALSLNVEALRDSLEMRDRQLESIKNVLVGNSDTSFVINTDLIQREAELMQAQVAEASEIRNVAAPQEPQNVTIPTFFPVPPPTKGQFTRDFTPSIGHFGLDIAAEKGSLIRSLADGVAIYADWTMNYGNVIYIQHSNGYISAYKHCESLYKKVGDVIAKNDVIATVGDGGVISSGPHLHLELWRNGLPLNPREYLTD